jgi:hypothetical protein
MNGLLQKFKFAELLSEFPGILQLGHLKEKKANQLTKEDIQAIGGAFNMAIPFTDEIQTAFISWLKGNDIDSVCDLIQNPESVLQIVQFFKGGYNTLLPQRSVIETPDLFII